MTDTEAQPTRLIFERISQIMGELPAIGKNQRNKQQDFNFRGVDDVLNALNPLLAKYSVFFAPECLERIAAQRTTRSGTVMYEVNLHVQYTFWTDDGSHFTTSAWGEGTDMGDKATNKAMTLAEKNVLCQVFAINTEDNADPDSGTPEETTSRTQHTPPPQANEPPPEDLGGWESEELRGNMHRELAAGVKTLSPAIQEKLKQHRAASGLPWPMTVQQFNDIIDYIEVLKTEEQVENGDMGSLDDGGPENVHDPEEPAPVKKAAPAKKAAKKAAAATKKAR